MQTVVRDLVNVHSPTLAGGVPEPASEILEARPAIREPDDLEDDAPWPPRFGHVDLDAKGKARSRWMVWAAGATLAGRDPFAFVASTRRGQRPASPGKALDVGLEARLVEMGRGMTPTTSAWMDGSALVVGRERGAIGALKLI